MGGDDGYANMEHLNRFMMNDDVSSGSNSATDQASQHTKYSSCYWNWNLEMLLIWNFYFNDDAGLGFKTNWSLIVGDEAN